MKTKSDLLKERVLFLQVDYQYRVGTML